MRRRDLPEHLGPAGHPARHGRGSPGGLGGICFLPALSALCGQTQQAPVLQVFYLVPTQGSVHFAFGANNIFGEMFIAGYAVDNSNVQGNYYARFNGTLQAQGEC